MPNGFIFEGHNTVQYFIMRGFTKKMELEILLVKYLRGSWVEVLSMLFANFDLI